MEDTPAPAPSLLLESDDLADGGTGPRTTCSDYQDGKLSDDGSFWGDSDDEAGGASELDREWQRRREQFYNSGYRDGITAGRNDAAQEGFNDGFKDSVLAGFNWGLVRGVTSALASLPDQMRAKMIKSEEIRREFKCLHESVASISSEDALKMFYNDTQMKKSVKERENPKSSSCPPSSLDWKSDQGILENYFAKLKILNQSDAVNMDLEIDESRVA